MAKPFRFRGPKSFSRTRKRGPLESLRSRLASRLTCLQRHGGGTWNPETGDGEAWHAKGDHLWSGWMMRRAIKSGRWAGPWVRKRVADL